MRRAFRRLGHADIVVIMRERTPFPARLFARLPRLQLLVTTGMRNLSIDLAAAERAGNLKVIDLDALKGKELESNIQLLIAAVKETKSTILIIDSLTALLLATESKFELRAFMKTVYKTLKSQGITTLMTISQTPGMGFGIEGFVADSVMLLENVVEKDQFKTRLMILKMRGTEHSKRFHTVSFAPKMSVSKY